MNRMHIALAVVSLLFCSAMASAALCAKCEQMRFTDDVGKCSQCGGDTASGAFKLCAACSAKMNKCQACLTPLAAVKPPATKPADAPATQPVPRADGPQGVFGKVTQMRGDFMPPAPRGKVVPIACQVNVYPGKIKFDLPADKRPAPVAATKSNKDGSYRIALEPGRYTVIVDVGVPSEMDGDGNLPVVTVEAGKWLAHDIRDTSQATF